MNDLARGGGSCHRGGPAVLAYGVYEEFALAPAMRRGDQYVESLRDGRAIFLDGERVADVTKHSAFAEPIRRIADRYDAARSAEAQPIATYIDPSPGAR